MISTVLLFIHLLHPFHVSVSDIKYKEEQKAIQITTRIFLDDLELALQKHMKDETLDILENARWSEINTNLESYLLERIGIWDAKGQAYELQYIGAEMEDDVMWCYLEIEKVKKLKEVRVTNRILHEVWADQENLIHFRAFDEVKSERLYKGANTKVFQWE